VIVVTGAGGDFCSGADLTSIRSDLTAEAQSGSAPARDLWSDINLAVLRDPSLATPVISAIEGVCFGAGAELVGATDIRVAGQGARFAFPEVRHGVIPSGGTLARLVRQIPYASAMEMLLTGQERPADHLHAMGFVNRVVPDGTALDAALDLAGVVAANGPDAIRAVKRTVAVSVGATLAEAYVAEAAAGRAVLGGAEAAEGARAFVAKRQPAWRLV